ncbi:hypothetical protein OGAPHI_003765 [Ogataea philodendri]|uniref:Small ribosomal subunit protein uS7 domain-containing protein n=1 Tax=Ogataea philodendri TaxID=1378263 RepID=A0A9P8P4Y7_9ASCO|nr:uncharacterized protein OGAPHI_003765 [Ogataea philodendri]KAH3665578.1 hypothetical protein OGAPHI_003765 [Ogataea philodendri]
MLANRARLAVFGRRLVQQHARAYAKVPQEHKNQLINTLKEIGVDNDGYLKKDTLYTEDTFKKSKFYQHIQKVQAEQQALIEKKLQLLSKENGVSVDELRKQLDERVNRQLEEASKNVRAIEQNIDRFEQQISLPFKVDLAGDVIKILKYDYEDIESSVVYQFLKQSDAKLAQEVRFSLGEPFSAEQKKSLESALASWGENKRQQLQELVKSRYTELLNYKVTRDTEPISITEVYDFLERYDNLQNSELYEILREVDPRFGTLYAEIRSLDEGEELKMRKAQLNRLLSDSSAGIYKVLNDLESREFEAVKQVLKDERARFEPLTAQSLVEFARATEKEQDLEIFDPIDESLSVFLQKARDSKNERVVAEIHELATMDGPLKTFLQDPSTDEYIALQSTVNKTRLRYQKKVLLDPLAREIKSLATEDQTNLSPEVVSMNQGYDKFMEVMDQMENELISGQYEPISAKLHLQAPRMLDNGPTPKQIAEFKALKGFDKANPEDQTLRFCANMVMRGGKRQRARKYINRALYLVYLETRENPVEILKKCLDAVAPLVVTRVVKTGFAKNYSVPTPLTPRQRLRIGFKWILESSDSRASNDFPVRLSEEILNIHRGNSKLTEKRVTLHKQAMAVRSYLRL